MALRALRPGDRGDVRRLWRATLALGRPLPFPLAGLAAYEALCLDWYLGPGRDAAAVLTDGAETVGYVLVCLDEPGYRRWAVPAALAWSARAAAGLLGGRLRGPSAAFTRLRLADGLHAARAAAPAPAHAHANLAPRARARLGALRLARHVDQQCETAGLPAWYGEVNARPGRRTTALQHRLGPVVARVPNRTLTWLAGHPVDRLTVVRSFTAPPGPVGHARLI